MSGLGLAAVGLLSAGFCAGLIVLLTPLLARYALARPNARSSHTVPTPQGGGIAVVAAALAVVWSVIALGPLPASAAGLAVVSVAAILVAVLGGIDDIRPLPAGWRLVLQMVVAASLVWLTPWPRIAPDLLPHGVERAVLAIGLVWFLNLVNFMDGLDWMTVAEIVPVCALLLACGMLGVLPLPATLVAAALLGAMLGFAPFNRPVARLFLGDVGSLPIGLLTGWMLIGLAAEAGIVAAILPPLYYLADTGLTLARRLVAREPFWEAHRGHYYQRATDRGFSVVQIDAHVFGLNLALAALSLATLRWSAWPAQAAALAVGSALTGAVLLRFGADRQTRVAA